MKKNHAEGFIVHTPEELQQLWNSLEVEGANVEVDFSRDSVVGLALGHSTGSALRLSAVKRVGRRLRVTILEEKRFDDAETRKIPFMVLRVPGKPASVSFESFGALIALTKKRPP